MYTTVDGRSQDLQGREKNAKWWPDEYDTIGFRTILVMAKRSCHRRTKAEGPFQYDCDPRSSRRRVKWYLRICDLFLNLLCVWQHLHLWFFLLLWSLLYWVYRVTDGCRESAHSCKNGAWLKVHGGMHMYFQLWPMLVIRASWKERTHHRTISRLIHDILWIWRLSFYRLALRVGVGQGPDPKEGKARSSQEGEDGKARGPAKRKGRWGARPGPRAKEAWTWGWPALPPWSCGCPALCGHNLNLNYKKHNDIRQGLALGVGVGHWSWGWPFLRVWGWKFFLLSREMLALLRVGVGSSFLEWGRPFGLGLALPSLGLLFLGRGWTSFSVWRLALLGLEVGVGPSFLGSGLAASCGHNHNFNNNHTTIIVSDGGGK